MFYAYKKCEYPSIIIIIIIILHSGYCVSKVIFYFPFFLDIISIVAKITKILVRIPYFKSIVPHIKFKKEKKFHINLRKMILKFHYA